jgi:hypothetical protein
VRVKSLYDQAVDVPGIGIVEPGEIIDVDSTMGKRMASSAMWRVTSRSKEEEDDENDTVELDAEGEE